MITQFQLLCVNPICTLVFFQEVFRGDLLLRKFLLLCKFFYCFETKFQRGQKSLRGANCLRGAPPAPPPRGRKPSTRGVCVWGGGGGGSHLLSSDILQLFLFLRFNKLGQRLIFRYTMLPHKPVCRSALSLGHNMFTRIQVQRRVRPAFSKVLARRG